MSDASAKPFLGKISFVEHVPTFTTGYEPTQVVANSQEELFDHAIFKSFRSMPNFFKFSIIRDRANQFTIMAEFERGASWWVVGFVNKQLELPTWKPLIKF